MTEDARIDPPPTLVGAAVLVGLQGLCLAVLGVLELFALNTMRATLAITTGLFFLGLGAGLVLCARGLFRVRSWSRGPVVALELIGVLLSFSFWGGETTLVAVLILLVSVGALVCACTPPRPALWPPTRGSRGEERRSLLDRGVRLQRCAQLLQRA